MPRELQCELCGSWFNCGKGEGDCWCRNVVVPEEGLRVLEKLARDCVCPSCLARFRVQE